ncbi:MAG: indolepyruvate ferredoxin oxidoreductase subunit alpha [Candidatus Solincola sediminis]|uniref:Indolepyruvate oxidoreductase subunit IorA n=1 Tax=Candidatus Solincola sediminis TaxID=1797199 RepID=A0A1F2WIZ7_9ACTN|nr:MAG: indolepyruvate ferredoxin oxidoreductase subunit alpha [Candidatus Solincola sediminis]OFW61079.1 MAG: indolepyruvate ferredoxin oxidoreductase subunit alpha [Candidatus Solincola sediminis]
MSGNEAVASGAYAAGVRVAAAYPGTPSTEILEELAKYGDIYCEWSPNEKVALEVAIGSCLGGARSLAAMKHVGLNVAADPWMTLPLIGVNAGFVLVVADDPGMHSSQNEQDSRYYARMAKVPLLEPADSQEAHDMVADAFALSERYDTPVMLRLETRISHSRTVVEHREERMKIDLPYERDAVKRVMIPGHARLRHPIVIERLADLEREAESFRFNRMELKSSRVGIVTSGVCYQYAREAFPEASILKLGFIYPMPEKLIREFASHFHRLFIVEGLEPYLEEGLKALGLDVVGKSRIPREGELNPTVVGESLSELIEMDTGVQGGGWSRPWHETEAGMEWQLPGRPPVMCPGCPHRGLFYALGRCKAIPASDIGCYTLSVLPPLEGIDCQVCMGASVGMALGLERAFASSGVNRAKAGSVVGVLGDSTFIHGGITGLIDMVYNRTLSTIIILDNRTTAMTGFQDHPGTGRTIMGEETRALDLEELAKAIGVDSVRVIDPWDLTETEKVIREEVGAPHTSVIISRRPCVLLERAARDYYEVDADLCNACGRCLRLGCPAIVMRGESAFVDSELCAGCSICFQLCRQEALRKVTPDG